MDEIAAMIAARDGALLPRQVAEAPYLQPTKAENNRHEPITSKDADHITCILTEIEGRLGELSARFSDAKTKFDTDTLDGPSDTDTRGIISDLKLLTAEARNINQAREQKYHDMTSLVGGISDEMRTQLRHGISIIDRVPLKKLFPHWKAEITKGLDVCREILPHLTNINEVSKIATGTLSWVEAPFAPQQVVLDTVKETCAKKDGEDEDRIFWREGEVQSDVLRQDADINFRIDRDVPRTVLGDLFRLKQVLSMLARRAIDVVHGQAGIRVTITKDPNKTESGGFDGVIRAMIQATSESVDWDQYASMVEEQIAGSSSAEHPPGLTLETLICRHLAREMRGDLYIQRNGMPSVQFTCYLTSAPALEVDIEKDLRSFRGHRVLIANTGQQYEDDIVQTLKQLQMKPVPMPLEDVASLAQHETTPDILGASTCVIVPSQQAALNLRTLKHLKRMPFIVMTGPPFEIDARTHLDIGIATYLTAPYTVDSLEIALASALKGRMRPSPFHCSPLDVGSMDVLVADDNAIVQKLATKFLEKFKCSVTIAKNGAEAVDIAKDRQFDAILMDVAMPVMGGVEASIKIRKHEHARGTAPMPIVLMQAGGNINKEDTETLGKLGIHQRLAKPMRGSNLARALKECSAQTAYSRRHAKI